MSKVTEIKFEPDQDMVATIKELLARIERGEIIAFAFAGLTQDRSVTTTWRRPNDMRHTALTGAVSFLEFRMNKVQDE